MLCSAWHLINAQDTLDESIHNEFTDYREKIGGRLSARSHTIWIWIIGSPLPVLMLDKLFNLTFLSFHSYKIRILIISSQPRDKTHVSCIAGRFFTIWAIKEAHNNIYPMFVVKIKWDSYVSPYNSNWPRKYSLNSAVLISSIIHFYSSCLIL